MKRTQLGIAISVVLLGLSAPSYAQENDPTQQDNATGIEVIQVTSQKRAQSINEVPIAISAMNETDIERLGAQDVRDMQFSVPNMIVTGYIESSPSFGIRGISDRSRNPGYDNRVGVYIDGVWVGRSSAANQSALDVERVEVLRGPQGTLFGKNTVAGAINIITKRPHSDELSGRLGVDIGNFGLQSYNGSINVPFSEDFSGRLSVTKTDRDGFVENSDPLGVILPADKFVDEFNNKDELATRAQFYWHAGENTNVSLSFDYVENKANVLLGEKVDDPLAPDVNVVSLDSTQRLDSTIKGSGLTIDHTFANDFQLTSVTGLRSSEWNLSDVDEDYSPLPYAFTEFQTEDSTHFSQELRLASPAYESFDYIVGAYYLTQSIEGDSDVQAFAPALNPAAPPVYVGASRVADVDADSYALFAHGNYRFTDQWSITAGLRYTYEEKAIDYTIVDTSGLFTNLSAKESRDASDVSPTVSLNWIPVEDLLLFARYSRGFKSGGYNADLINDAEALPFEDESVDSYEIGFKSPFLDNTLNLNANVFISQHDDYQVQSFTQLPSGGTAITITNAAEVESKGFELELQWQPIDSLQLWANYGYTDAEFKAFPEPAGPGTDFSGNQLAEAPKYTYGIGAEYRYSLNYGDFVVQADYFKRDKFYSNPDNAVSNLNQERGESAARIGFEAESGAWNVFLWGKNLADDVSQIHNSTSFLGIGRAQYSQPRTYGVKGQYKF
ncbi:TonB-dependent receptor [Shewanella sp. 10N.286.52.B9]|uniref:TonB-dependent receptor n=1 Tax=Shewanella sp. 10N.286.52.B9 TaxID=1880837 RepID=UPI000C8295FE|nr:TonB-dependent receptor [Shewanella sp. 10N.286.52.B9]PMG50814.1 hypothetical protein BCU91_01700 [Shewanella sp. 10N.286.52.B9]